MYVRVRMYLSKCISKLHISEYEKNIPQNELLRRLIEQETTFLPNW